MDEAEAAEAGVLVCKSPQLFEESRLGHGNSNPDVEWILCEPWPLVRSGLDPAQSPSSSLVDRVALREVARNESLDRNTNRVSNPGQGDAPLVEARTTLLPPRRTESSAGPLLLPAARRRSQPCPTDPHSPLKCPSCGSDQDSTVCSGQALALNKSKAEEALTEETQNKEKKKKFVPPVAKVLFQIFR